MSFSPPPPRPLLMLTVPLSESEETAVRELARILEVTPERAVRMVLANMVASVERYGLRLEMTRAGAGRGRAPLRVVRGGLARLAKTSAPLLPPPAPQRTPAVDEVCAVLTASHEDDDDMPDPPPSAGRAIARRTPGAPSTLDELEAELEDRGLSLQTHPGFHAWIAWLYPPDDPSLLCAGEAPSLAVAIRRAFEQWDQGSRDKTSSPPAPPFPSAPQSS
jgi:hypothetical protein